MNGNGIYIRRVDSGRVKQIGNEPAERFVAPPRESIREIPPGKLKEMRPGNRRNSPPKNSAGLAGLTPRFWPRHGKIIDALRIKVDVDTTRARQPLQQFA